METCLLEEARSCGGAFWIYDLVLYKVYIYYRDDESYKDCLGETGLEAKYIREGQEGPKAQTWIVGDYKWVP